MSDFLFTSESVTEGHPDKVCDRIADRILDDIIANDPHARVACEVCANTGLVFIFGEITTEHYCNMAEIARDTVREIGYTSAGTSATGFSAESCAVIVSVDEQSADIWDGVSHSIESRAGSDDPLDQRGAGDQGLMFGYACTESEWLSPGTFMPLPISLAHSLARQLSSVRKSQMLPELRPDGKTQVTIHYQNHRPVEVATVLVSSQHAEDAQQAALHAQLFEHVLRPVLPAKLCPGSSLEKVEFLCNPSGHFVKGGPEADSGLTGRKVIVDTYGGSARHGGGSFSGKDPSKVDRSAAYYARYVTKQLVAAGAAQRLELQVSYAIGRAQPTSLHVETFGTGQVDDSRILALLRDGELFDFRPLAIVQELGLLDHKRVRYAEVAAYGHFGRPDLNLPWEQLDKVDAVQQALGL
jgi:S-adenosylmethionine synthetase